MHEDRKTKFNDRQVLAIQEAAKDVCEIFNSKEFREIVQSKRWLASCDKINGKADEVSGADVYTTLSKKINNYSIHPRKPWLAIAQTQRNERDPRYNRVAISPKRIEAWNSSIDSVKSELFNTIAHETMHIISFDFADSGHGSVACPDERLVSYEVGNIVEKLWLSKRKK